MVLSNDFKTIRELPPDIAKMAKKELNENSKTVKNDIQHLKEWLSTQPHLRARSDDQWLVAMLRGCKFNLEKTKQKLDLYYTLRTTAPDVVLRLKPTDEKFLDFFKKGTLLVLQKPNKLYPRVILLRAGAYDPTTHHVADIMCVLYYLIQILIVDDDIASVVGTKMLVDYEGVTMRHLIQASPSIVKKMITVCMEAFPLRLKETHHINVPPGIDKIFTIVSVFLNKKAKERLKIRKNRADILEHIPKDILPKDYGGNGQSVEELTDYWVFKFKEYRTWMEQEMTFGTDESKRLAKPNKDSGVIAGFLRKLNIID